MSHPASHHAPESTWEEWGGRKGKRKEKRGEGRRGLEGEGVRKRE